MESLQYFEYVRISGNCILQKIWNNSGFMKRGMLLKNYVHGVRHISGLTVWLQDIEICAAIAAWVEDCFSRPGLIQGIAPTQFDLLILLGMGTVHSELEGAVTRWAAHHQLPCLHVIGNYDHVSSKGFRGISPRRLLVWGPQMLEDAVAYQGISSKGFRSLDRCDTIQLIKISYKILQNS